MPEPVDTVLPPRRTASTVAGHKLRDAQKVLHNPLPVIASDSQLRKPDWLRVRLQGGGKVSEVRRILRRHNLVTVCEEAACPNLAECFSGGTATFMIMGDICTRKCPFCDVAHGKPQPLDINEPQQLAAAIAALGLHYAVITSVDRDDLRDGGAAHFAQCISAVRAACPDITIEVLVPDFRGRIDVALKALQHIPDVFNHNLETVPRLYREVRPGASYAGSLDLLCRFSEKYPDVSTKSGLMLGLGESIPEVMKVLRDLRAHGVTMLTLGQYLQPSSQHLPVQRYVTPQEFEALAHEAKELGFTRVASGPLVRSSYHADRQTSGQSVT